MRKTVLLTAVALLTFILVLQHNRIGMVVADTNGNSSGTMVQTVPAAPSDLTVTGVTSNSVSIAWTDNSSDEEGFQIDWCTGANCTDFQLLATMPAGVNNITQWSLSKNKTYKYRVCAYNAAGNSGYTNTVSATTLR
jgi:Fibronectin type III domain